MPSPHSLALVGDDERLLTLLAWQLMSERAEVGSKLLLTQARQSRRADKATALRGALSGRAALVLCFQDLEALSLCLTVAQERALPVLVCSPSPSLEEATLCLRGGAREYLDQPWRSKVDLTEVILRILDVQRPDTQTTLTSPDASSGSLDPAEAHSAEPRSLLELIDTSLSFQEALTPIEDELRKLYLTEVLREEGSLNAAARRAGVDRSNFKRLLKRYDVTREGEPS